MGLTTMTNDLSAKWEAEARARDARLEYGRTVEDLRHLLNRAKQVQIAVRVGSTDNLHDVTFPVVSRTAVRDMFKCRDPDEFAPCEFDPIEKNLVVGSLRAIRKAREGA